MINMRVLELFRGTGSIGKYCEELGYDVFSLDIDPKAQASVTTDIMNWDYAMYPVGHFDIIWASPPCTEYSTMCFRRPRKLDVADAIVQRVLDIINYFKPTTWYIENPRSGMLKTRPFMVGLPYYDVSYCRYGYLYRKHTRIWTNMKGFKPLYCNKDCESMKEGKHTSLVLKTRSLAAKHSKPQPRVKALIDCQVSAQ